MDPGSVVAEHYRLIRPIGEGGMGVVWEAEHVETNERFALKFLKAAQEEARRRFQREVRAAAAVQHPNVVRIHDFMELPDQTLVIVMELLVGETLASKLKAAQRLPLPEISALLLPVIEALGAAHALGIIHRDLKPENIFLVATGREPIVKVVDFGVAKLTAEEGLAARTQALTDTGSMVGTPYYMSPEQVFSEKDIDLRADVWSLGIVLYECLAGHRPTEDENVGRVLRRIMQAEFEPLTKHCPDLPADVADLVRRMLSANRESRPSSLTEVRAILERHASDQIASRPPRSIPPPAHAIEPRGDTHGAVSLAPTTPPPGRKNRPPAIAIGVGAVAIAAIGFAVWGKGQNRPALPPALPAVAAATAPSVTAAEPPHDPISVTTTAPLTRASSSPPTPTPSASVSTVPPVGSIAKPRRAPAAPPVSATAAAAAPAAPPTKPAAVNDNGGVVETPPF